MNKNYQIDISLLKETIETDLKNGCYPVAVIGNAATVNTAAIDDLHAIYEVCQAYQLWFHVDGAFGAPAKLVAEYGAQLDIISKADSLAFDYHKWFSVPYEAGCILIKDKQKMRDSFAISPPYLMQHNRGLVGVGDSINNYGMELSRSFKALKVWMHIKEHGMIHHANIIEKTSIKVVIWKKKLKRITT